MKLAHLFFSDKPDLKWTLCSQMGIRYAVAKLSPELTGRKPVWDFDTLESIKLTFADNGFELIALEGDQFDMSRIKLGLPGREEDAEFYRRMLSNMGRLGITTLCYNFMPTGWFRTACDIVERGGALVTGFDSGDAARLPAKPYAPLPADKLWDNYKWFIDNVMDAAEEAGVKMGLHPDDPPVPSIEGIDRIFISPESIDRALSLSSSPSHGLTFCQGSYKTMGADLPALIRKWKDRIFFVHIRDVQGTPDHFHETFHDNGPTDMPSVLSVYKEVGFDGVIRSDHVPTMAGDDNGNPSYSMLGTLFGVGYLKGMLDAIGAGAISKAGSPVRRT